MLFFLVWHGRQGALQADHALGIAWIVLQPVVSMVVFSLLFGGLLNVPSNGVPYPIFAFATLVPSNSRNSWQKPENPATNYTNDTDFTKNVMVNKQFAHSCQKLVR